jgi:hypothetical protein
LIEPAASGVCRLDFLATLDGVAPVASSFAEAIQLYDGMRAHLATRVADFGYPITHDCRRCFRLAFARRSRHERDQKEGKDNSKWTNAY